MSRPSVPSWCFSTISRLHDGAHAAEPGDVAFARHTRVALVVPSGRGLRTGGDAHIRGKEQPAGSRASCRPLLRFVHLNSERTAEHVRQDGSFAEKQQSHRALLFLVPSGRERRTGGDVRIRERSSQPVPSPRVDRRSDSSNA